MSETLANLLAGDPPVAPRQRRGSGHRDRQRFTRPPGLTGWASGPAQADRPALGTRRGTEVLDWSNPPVREVVRRRQAQRRRTTASTATSRPATATRSPSTGRASRATAARSPTPTCTGRGQPGGQRPAPSPRRAPGRPGRDLHADDPRGGRRDAGLRPHRRRPLAWSSAASPPTRSPAASRTRRPRSSSPPTAATGAARRPR